MDILAILYYGGIAVLVPLFPTVLGGWYCLRAPVKPPYPTTVHLVQQERPSRALTYRLNQPSFSSDSQSIVAHAQVNDSFFDLPDQNFVLNPIQYWIGIIERRFPSDLEKGKNESNLKTIKDLQKCREIYLVQDLNINIDDLFCESLRGQEYDEGTTLERHHVIPKHADGSDEDSNILKISVKDHTYAHFFRYLQFGEVGDGTAFLLRRNQNASATALKRQLIMESNKSNKLGFWNSELQREQGLKGGSKGGSANTEEQFLSRQKTGLLFGKMVGKSNQSETLKKKLPHTLRWVYNIKSETPLTIHTPPCETFKEVIDILNIAVPGSIRNPGSFYKVIHGHRKGMYGWTLIDKV